MGFASLEEQAGSWVVDDHSARGPVIRLLIFRHDFQFLRQPLMQNKAAPANPSMTHLDVNLSKAL
jgi:hypothetical protein